jgi:flagellar biosynthesis GTPase FlhF
MQLETFRGRELHKVVKEVRRTLGEDAMIVSTRTVRRPDGDELEVVAARPEVLERFRQKLDGGRAAALRAQARKRIGPYTVALVGPAGAGKTSTALKVALHPRGVGGRRVGLITTDTYRVGALEEIQTYAEIADLPLEVVYQPTEVPAALQRLRTCEVIVVDTPGRGFGAGAAAWTDILEALDPDETHLVVPAAFRTDVAESLVSQVPGVRPTHVLFSKLDETPGPQALVELAETLELPARWVSSSPEIPGGLGVASTRILAALGIRADDDGASTRRAG